MQVFDSHYSFEKTNYKIYHCLVVSGTWNHCGHHICLVSCLVFTLELFLHSDCFSFVSLTWVGDERTLTNSILCLDSMKIAGHGCQKRWVRVNMCGRKTQCIISGRAHVNPTDWRVFFSPTVFHRALQKSFSQGVGHWYQDWRNLEEDNFPLLDSSTSRLHACSFFQRCVVWLIKNINRISTRLKDIQGPWRWECFSLYFYVQCTY